jgi:hypothetical protein
MQRRAEPQLGRRVPPAVADHASPNGWRRRPWRLRDHSQVIRSASRGRPRHRWHGASRPAVLRYRSPLDYGSTSLASRSEATLDHPGAGTDQSQCGTRPCVRWDRDWSRTGRDLGGGGSRAHPAQRRRPAGSARGGSREGAAHALPGLQRQTTSS